MATKTKKSTKGVHAEHTAETAVEKSEQFFQKYAKQFFTVLIVAIVVVGAFFAYKYLYQIPREGKAANEMYVAQQLFAKGDYETALNGNGNGLGFLDMVSKYGGTKHGKLAAHYAGICFMKEGDNESALTYLQKYKRSTGPAAVVINAQNFGLRGDVHADNGDYDKALAAYKKAINAANNVLTTPYYLKKEALVLEKMGKYADAIKSCKRISDEYPGSMEARDIDKYIGYLEQK